MVISVRGCVQMEEVETELQELLEEQLEEQDDWRLVCVRVRVCMCVRTCGDQRGCVAQMSFGGHHAKEASDRLQKKLQEEAMGDGQMGGWRDERVEG